MFRVQPQFRISQKSIRRLVVTAGAALVLVAGSAAHAHFINFNTDAAGNPYTGLGDSFPAAEYAALGVTINDSDPSTGLTYVNLTNPLNVGTAIYGYYVNVGAFAGTATYLDLLFTTPVTSLSFNFATPSGQLDVSAYGTDGGLLASLPFSGSDPFLNQAGFNQNAGYASLSGLGSIRSLRITPGANEGLIFDNLNFTVVPVPTAVWLLGSGLLGLLGIARRKESCSRASACI